MYESTDPEPNYFEFDEPLEPSLPDTGDYYDREGSGDLTPIPDLLPTEIAPQISGGIDGTPIDPELADLVSTATEALSFEAVDEIMAANRRFNRPIEVATDDGVSVTDRYHVHRRLLHKLPAFAAAGAEAGIDLNNSVLLLTDMLDRAKWVQMVHPDQYAEGLTRIMEACATNEQPVTTDDFQLLHTTLLEATKMEVETRALATIRAGQDAGLTVAQSATIWRNFCANNNITHIGYHSDHLRNALSALNITSANPALIEEAFTHIGKLPGEEAKDAYQEFKVLIGRAGPKLGHTTNDILSAFNEKVSAGMSIQDAMVSIGIPYGERNSITPPERYFTYTAGKLRHSYTPYQTERPLNDGLRDIESLTNASMYDGDVIAEGYWFFNPETNCWYSLGGETTYRGMGSARHEYMPYDAGQLGDSLIHVHIHPKEFVMQDALFGDIFPSGADFIDVADVRETASRPVALQSLISHRFGITVLTCPDNNEAVRSMGETFSSMRDSMYDESFASAERLTAYANAVGHDVFAARAIAAMNRRLPPGFSIKLYPHGTDMETILGAQRQPDTPSDS